MELIKNVEHAKTFELTKLVDYDEGAVNSLALSQLPGCRITVLAIAEGEGLSTHAAPGDAMVYVLEGTGEITIAKTPHTLEVGQSIIMPCGVPHAVKAITDFKMLLVVVKEG